MPITILHCAHTVYIPRQDKTKEGVPQCMCGVSGHVYIQEIYVVLEGDLGAVYVYPGSGVG